MAQKGERAMRVERRLFRYGVAIGLTAIAIFLNLWLETILSRTTEIFFYMAIALSTWYSGRRPGIVTLILSALALKYFFISPVHKIYVENSAEALWLLLVIVVGLVINLLTATLQETRRAEAERMGLLEQEQATRKEVERLLRLLETERYWLEQVLQQMPVGVAIAEVSSGNLLFHNEEAVRLLRHPFFHSETDQRVTQYGALHNNGQPYQPQEYPLVRSLLFGEVIKAEEMHYRRGDGTKTLLSVSAAPILNQEGQVGLTVSTFEDISARKQAEQALAKELLRIQTLFNTSLDGIVILNEQGNVIDANPRFSEMMGYTPEETLQLNIQDWDAQFTAEELQQIMLDCLSHRRGVFETLHRRKDGSIYEVEISYSIVEWEDNTLGFCVCRDVSDRKRAEAKLQERERLFSTLAEALPVAIFRFDAASQCNYVNHYWTTMSGRTPESVMGSGWVASLHPEDRDRLVKEWLDWSQNARERGLYRNEGRLVHLNGRVVWYYIQALAEVDDRGETVGLVCVMTDITNRKQAEQALQEREAILRLFAQYAPAGIAMFDQRMRYAMASQRWVDDYQFGSIELLLGRSHYEIFPNIPHRWRQVHQRCLAGASETCDEDWYVRTDGNRQWIRWDVRPWYRATGEIGGIIIFSEDITQRKRAEAAVLQLNQELQQKVTELQTLLDVIPIGIGIAEDPHCRNIRVNPAFTEVLSSPSRIDASLSPSDAERPAPFKIYQNGREMAVEELPLQYAASHGVEIRDLEVEIVWENGTTITLLEYAAPLLDEDGQPRGSVGAFLNITDRKRAEQALRTSEQQLKLALQAAKAGAWTWQLKTNQVYWSDEYYRVFGLEPGSIELSHENSFRQVHPDDREWVKQETIEAINQGKNTNIEYRILLPNGALRWVTGIGQMFYDESNQPVSMAGIVLDITERKQAEAELRKREELYRALARNFPNGAVQIFDHDLRYLLSDGEEVKQAGLAQEQLEGRTIWEALPPETSAVLEPLYRAALAGEMTSTELAFAEQSYQIYTLPLQNEQGEIFAGLSMSQNVTLLKQAEQTLRTARDELERQVQERTRELQRSNQELEQFAYVASHDLQEPLRAIASFTQLLAKQYQDKLDVKANGYIEFIVDGATRMQQLIRDLLAYSRAGRHELKLQAVDCNVLLERVEKNLQVVIAENRAEITADPLPTITADPTQIMILLQNLIGNSLKYRSEADPHIHIGVTPIAADSEEKYTAAVNEAAQQDGTPSVMPPNEWLFSIRDNGIGIEPQYAERIFGIFQRLHTSDEYSGTGLGLAICRRIIERYGGRIWVESQLRQGATFFFTIPISTRSQDEHPP